MSIELPMLPTVGTISKAANRPPHCVEWVIHSRGIKPITKVGNINIYSREDAQRIADELAKIDKVRKLRGKVSNV